MARPQVTSIMPGFSVRSLSDAIDFYTQRLGFHIIFQNTGVFAIVARDGAEISLGLDRSGKRAGYGQCSVKMQDLPALAEEFRAQGIEMTATADDPNSPGFQINDPDGNTVNFGPAGPAARLPCPKSP